MGIPKLDIEYTGAELSDAKRLVEEVHYSGTARSQMQVHVFLLKHEGKSVGAAIFGKPMSRHYDSDTLELRRFVLIDEMPRNTESWFLSRCLKWIEKNDRSVVRIVTFADPNHGHQGTIYKATNFMPDGQEQSPNPRVVKMGKKVIHLRQAYQKKNGVYSEDAVRIQEALSQGRAIILKQKHKLKYTYWFRR